MRCVLPRHARVAYWHSHTLVRTRGHHVDALTGVEGCEAAKYLDTYWYYPDALRLVGVEEIDVLSDRVAADERGFGALD